MFQLFRLRPAYVHTSHQCLYSQLLPISLYKSLLASLSIGSNSLHELRSIFLISQNDMDPTSGLYSAHGMVVPL